MQFKQNIPLSKEEIKACKRLNLVVFIRAFDKKNKIYYCDLKSKEDDKFWNEILYGGI